MDPQLTGLTVSGAELEAIKACLASIRAEVDATCILLLDHSGQVIASRSRKSPAEEMTIGALLAGTFMSSRELSKVLKETEFKTLIQQGDRESIYAEQINGQWILSIIFSKYALLGMVKVIAKRAVGELETILEQVRRGNRDRDRRLSEQMRVSMQDSLDLLFQDLESGSSLPSEVS